MTLKKSKSDANLEPSPLWESWASQADPGMFECSGCGRTAMPQQYASIGLRWLYPIAGAWLTDSDDLCPRCQDAKASDRRAQKRNQALDSFDLTVPTKFRGAQLSDFGNQMSEICLNWLNDPGSWALFITGKVGRGKTRLAFANLRKWIEQTGRGTNWITVPDLFDKINIRYRNAPAVRDYQRYNGMLLLDDLGAEVDTRFVTQELYRIVSARESYSRKTVITTNLELSELAEQLGDERIVSRLTSGKLIELVGEDRRKLKQQTEGMI